MFLPIFAKPEGGPRPGGEPTVQVSDAISAASGVVQYVGAMCSEKPDVCLKGGETLTALGYQVGDGARVAYDLLRRHFKDQQSTAQAGAATAHANADQVAAITQPMPAKRIAGTETADVVVTGTVKLPSSIPLPMPRPHI